MNKKIRDKNISLSNYATFNKCKIINNGAGIKFIYANNKNYCVPLKTIIKWFSFSRSVSKNKKILSIRRICGKSIVRIYCDDKSSYDVAWDTVLMACESRYEHFGGMVKDR